MWKGREREGKGEEWNPPDIQRSVRGKEWIWSGPSRVILTSRQEVEEARGREERVLGKKDDVTIATACSGQTFLQGRPMKAGGELPIILPRLGGKREEERQQETGERDRERENGREGEARNKEKKGGEQRPPRQEEKTVLPQKPRERGAGQHGADAHGDVLWEEEVIDRFIRVFGQVQAKYMKEGGEFWTANSFFQDYMMMAGLLAATIAAPAEEDGSAPLIVPLTPWIPLYFPEEGKIMETEKQLRHQLGVCVGIRSQSLLERVAAATYWYVPVCRRGHWYGLLVKNQILGMGGVEGVGETAISLDSLRGWLQQKEKQRDMACVARFARALLRITHPGEQVPARWSRPMEEEEIKEVAVVQQKEAGIPTNQHPDRWNSSGTASSNDSSPQRKLFLCGDHVAANYFKLKHWPKIQLRQLFQDAQISPQNHHAPLVEPKRGCQVEDGRRRLTGTMKTTSINLFDIRLTKGQEYARGCAWRVANAWMGKGPAVGAGLLTRVSKNLTRRGQIAAPGEGGEGPPEPSSAGLPTRKRDRSIPWKMTGVTSEDEESAEEENDQRR
uniref:Uncharacterized protein n=1 Tax=Chromera velia CCMP2878 TaxID=1169474 RepID=A0A0G4HT75_9ALVE|eukprot:Cvel_31298.t1-p1 / transcript=Cvel_31298.t1 / gene=Cvel_31298 / organism=Chromera_velia_CCMP2878 / gene_product=hypothetical protein / transcript_product=hypothetical protein / location=Cvel_scaffold4639:1996-3669(+) / protein_length=558 / sequence_SO=supercontig / SO=protein_coding / is_pseudo=false